MTLDLSPEDFEWCGGDVPLLGRSMSGIMSKAVPKIKADLDSSSIPNPRDYGLPHDTWRKHQFETLVWLLADERPSTIVIESPTGSGKTSWPAAASRDLRVVSLVRTKSLQMSNYEKEYGFDAHYGRGNYLCKHPGADPGTMCDQCMYLDSGSMHNCPASSSCLYLISKDKALHSRKASLNYAYWMTASGWRVQYPPDMLVCDEAHNLSDIVLDWVGVTLGRRESEEWDLPPYPEIEGSGGGVLIKTESPTDIALAWLSKAYQSMTAWCSRLEKADDKTPFLKADRLRGKIGNTMNALERCPDDWYIKSGPRARRYRGKMEPAFLCKPLTARHHAGRYFSGDFDAVLMSATIGNPDTFAAELGLEDWVFKAVPNQWPPERRPVHVLDAPKMGYKSTQQDYERQANVIAEAIKSVDPTWSGFIHVTRKDEAKLLADRLARRGLQDRVWVTPGHKTYVGTDRQIKAWEARKRRHPNSICVSWSMWEGIDGRDEKICIAAKTPFGSLGDPYEKARMRYSGKFYLQRAAWQLEQGLGRTRRGREQDYDGSNGEKHGLVCIADGNYTRVRSYLSSSMKQSLATGI